MADAFSSIIAPSAPGRFTASIWDRLDRFLILGVDGGTYYAGETDLAKTNVDNLLQCVLQDGLRTVDRIAQIAVERRAIRQTPGIFALAYCAVREDRPTRRAAYLNLSKVCVTASHLFEFMKFYKLLNGKFPRSFRTALQNWYVAKSPEDLTYQVVKYKQRHGWTHRDVLRLAHIDPKRFPRHADVLQFAVDEGLPALITFGADDIASLQPCSEIVLLNHFEALRRVAQNPQAVAEILSASDLPREAVERVDTGLLNDARVWAALLPKMPATALTRNLGKMSAVGLVSDGSPAESEIVRRLSHAKLHPFALFLAWKTYTSGGGFRGKLRWSPTPAISSALIEATERAFTRVPKTNLRMLFGIDISGSMDTPIANTNITCAEGALALAKVLSLQAESYSAFGFNVRYTPIDLCPPLGNVLRAARPWFGGATDCSLPMTFATQQRLPVDVFVVLTDNETNANTIAPAEALRKYRKAMQIDAKLVVVAMTAGEISIADPNDSGMLDCVGFDSALPEVIQSFLGIGGSDYAE